MRITTEEIKLQVNHVNNYVLENSIYKIRHQRHSGYHWLYLHTDADGTDRRLRCLTGGSAREINAYLTALQHKHWYMQEPF